MEPAIEAMTPEERMAARRCPECGELLTRHSAKHHRMNHWGYDVDLNHPLRGEAKRRADLLDAFIKAEDLAFETRRVKQAEVQ